MEAGNPQRPSRFLPLGGMARSISTQIPSRGNHGGVQQSGFSLHAGVACKSNQRKKLERLYRYITRPAIAEQRLSLASSGKVVVALKAPYDDGTSHVVLSPMEFIGRLAALGAARHGICRRQ